MRDLAFGNGRFVLVGPDGLRLSSADGEVREHEARDPGNNLSHGAWTGKEFLATGGKTALASPDGVTWQPWGARVPSGVLAVHDGLFLGTTWPGQMWHSRDGREWHRAAPLSPNGTNEVAFGTVRAK